MKNRIEMMNSNEEYKDYSEVWEDDQQGRKHNTNSESSLSSNSSRNSKNSCFASKLHYMLSELEKEGYDDIIGWQPHGRSFIIRDRKRFVESIISKWYQQKSFPSFQRQLNLYCFRLITDGPDKGSYYHRFFLRGKPFLTENINRRKGMKKIPAEPVPDFYGMKFLPSQCINGNKMQTNHTVVKDSPTTEVYPIQEIMKPSVPLIPKPYINLLEEKRRHLILTLQLKALQEQNLLFNYCDRLPTKCYLNPSLIPFFGQHNMM